MSSLTKSIVINAPAAMVAILLDDPLRLPEWFVGITRVNPDGRFPSQIGSKNHITYRAAGINFETHLTTLEFSPNESRVFRLDGMINGINRWELSPNQKQTRLTVTYEYDVPSNVLGKLAMRVLEKINEHNVDVSLHNFKILVETMI